MCLCEDSKQMGKRSRILCCLVCFYDNCNMYVMSEQSFVPAAGSLKGQCFPEHWECYSWFICFFFTPL